MNNEFDIIQELSIGDKLRREAEINKLLEVTDPMEPGYIDLMRELSTIMHDKIEFMKSYSENLKDNE